MDWKEATQIAIKELTVKNKSKIFSRQELIDIKLNGIILSTGANGKTPAQTLSRTLQELRDDHVIEFISRGRYRLLK